MTVVVPGARILEVLESSQMQAMRDELDELYKDEIARKLAGS